MLRSLRPTNKFRASQHDQRLLRQMITDVRRMMCLQDTPYDSSSEETGSLDSTELSSQVETDVDEQGEVIIAQLRCHLFNCGPVDAIRFRYDPSDRPVESWAGFSCVDYATEENPKAGAKVTSVVADGPAEDAGLEVNDIIIGINGTRDGKPVYAGFDVDNMDQDLLDQLKALALAGWIRLDDFNPWMAPGSRNVIEVIRADKIPPLLLRRIRMINTQSRFMPVGDESDVDYIFDRLVPGSVMHLRVKRGVATLELSLVLEEDSSSSEESYEPPCTDPYSPDQAGPFRPFGGASKGREIKLRADLHVGPAYFADQVVMAIRLGESWQIITEPQRTLPAVMLNSSTQSDKFCGIHRVRLRRFLPPSDASDSDGMDSSQGNDSCAVGGYDDGYLCGPPDELESGDSCETVVEFRARADQQGGGFYPWGYCVKISWVDRGWQIITPPMRFLDGLLTSSLVRNGQTLFTPFTSNPSGGIHLAYQYSDGEELIDEELDGIDTGKIPSGTTLPIGTAVSFAWNGRHWVLVSYDCDAADNEGSGS